MIEKTVSLREQRIVDDQSRRALRAMPATVSEEVAQENQKGNQLMVMSLELVLAVHWFIEISQRCSQKKSLARSPVQSDNYGALVRCHNHVRRARRVSQLKGRNWLPVPSREAETG